MDAGLPLDEGSRVSVGGVLATWTRFLCWPKFLGGKGGGTSCASPAPADTSALTSPGCSSFGGGGGGGGGEVCGACAELAVLGGGGGGGGCAQPGSGAGYAGGGGGGFLRGFVSGTCLDLLIGAAGILPESVLPLEETAGHW